MGVPLMHRVTDIHSSMVVAIATLNCLSRREKRKLLEDRLTQKLEHFICTQRGFVSTKRYSIKEKSDEYY